MNDFVFTPLFIACKSKTRLSPTQRWEIFNSSSLTRNIALNVALPPYLQRICIAQCTTASPINLRRPNRKGTSLTMSQVLTSTNVPSNSVHPQHRNPSASNAAAEIRPNIETLQVQDHDTAHGTASAETGTTGTTQREMKNSRANIVIIQLTATALLASISSGLINICIPRMAIDL